MNKAAGLVAESIIGEAFATVVINGKPYSVYPPTIKILCRAIASFYKVSMTEEYTKLSIIGEVPENAPHIIKGLAALIVGDVRLWKWRAKRIEKRLQSCTITEIREIAESIIPLLGGDDFFVIATSLKSVTEMVAKNK